MFEDVIFKGKILTAEATKDGSKLKAVFIVQKGIAPEQLPDTIFVLTNAGPTSCGLFFRAGDTWLIFANRMGRDYESSTCSNSRRQMDKDDEQEIKQIIAYIDTIRNKQLINEEISSFGNRGSYHIVGRMEDRKPVGSWFKIKDKDTIGFYNFRDGKQFGMQKKIDRATNYVYENKIDYQDGNKIEKITYSRDKKMMWRFVLKNGIVQPNIEISAGKTGAKQTYINGDIKDSVYYNDQGIIIKKD
jgi:hypothetical protein